MYIYDENIYEISVLFNRNRMNTCSPNRVKNELGKDITT